MYLSAILQNFYFVLTARGFVIGIRSPFAIRIDVLIMKQSTQIIALFFWTNHRNHWLMVLGWVSRLKNKVRIQIQFQKDGRVDGQNSDIGTGTRYEIRVPLFTLMKLVYITSSVQGFKWYSKRSGMQQHWISHNQIFTSIFLK